MPSIQQLLIENGRSPLVRRETPNGVYERLRSVRTRLREDGTPITSQRTSWRKADPSNAYLSVIPGAILGRPLNIPLLRDNAPTWRGRIADWESEAFFDSRNERTRVFRHASQQGFESDYSLMLSEYARYLTDHNLRGFRVIILGTSGAHCQVDVIDPDGYYLPFIGEDRDLQHGPYSGQVNYRVVTENLLSKAMFLRSQGQGYTDAVEKAAFAQIVDVEAAGGSLTEKQVVRLLRAFTPEERILYEVATQWPW